MSMAISAPLIRVPAELSFNERKDCHVYVNLDNIDEIRDSIHWLKKEIDKVDIEVDFVDNPENLAIQNYIDFHTKKGDKWLSANPEFPDDFKVRVTVNFIKHSLTSYADSLDFLTNKRDKSIGYLLLNGKIYKKIAKHYPHLLKECARQYAKKINQIGLWGLHKELL